MLNPITGIEIGKEVDAVRKENDALRSRIEDLEELIEECLSHLANPGDAKKFSEIGRKYRGEK